MRAYPHPEVTVYLLPASASSAYHFSKYPGPAAIRRGAKGRVLPLYTLSTSAAPATETFSLVADGIATVVGAEPHEVCQSVRELTGQLRAFSLVTKDGSKFPPDRAGSPPMPRTPPTRLQLPTGKPAAVSSCWQCRLSERTGAADWQWTVHGTHHILQGHILPL
jgi:hypothetical protein